MIYRPNIYFITCNHIEDHGKNDLYFVFIGLNNRLKHIRAVPIKAVHACSRGYKTLL